MGSKKAKILMMLSGFFIVVLIMFRDSFQAGKMLFGNDTITIYMAFAVFAKKMTFIYHSLPAWLPDICMGMPMIGSSSLLFFYPTDFLFMLLPLPVQFMYLPDLVIHMFLAALGMYLFLRKLKLEQPAAFFGASVIMTAGFIISYVYAGHWNNIKAGALIPLAFYFTQSALEDKKLLHYLNTAFILALMMLATAMQIMAYTFLAIIFYAVLYISVMEKEKAAKIKSVMYLGLCAAFIMLFSAPQFIPSMQYTNYSWRGDFSYDQFISWSFHPAELITFLLPQFFGLFSNTYWGYMPFTLTTYYFGALPFLLLFFLGLPGKHKKYAVFFSALSVVFAFFAFGGYTFIYKIFYFIPVFRQFRNPSRFLYLVTFFVTTLASIGLNNLLEEKEEKKKLRILLWPACGAAVFAAFFSISLGGGIDGMLGPVYKAIKNTAMPAGVMSATKEMIRSDLVSFFFVSLASLAVMFLAVRKKIRSAFLAAFILVAVNFADVYRIDSKFITFEDYSRFIPAKNEIAQALASDREPFRTANFDQAFGPNRNIYYGVDNIRGMHGLMPAAFEQMDKAGCFGSVNINRQFNVRYYFNQEELNIPGFVKVMDTGTIKVYRDDGAKNRVFFINSIIRTAGAKEILSYMTSAAYNGTAAAAGPEFPQINEGGEGNAIITGYRPGAVKAVVDSVSGGAVVMSEGYFKQWKARLDGRDAAVYRVNYDACAVVIPAGGRHEIEFYYDKTGIYAGLVIALLAFAFYGVILFRSRRPADG